MGALLSLVKFSEWTCAKKIIIQITFQVFPLNLQDVCSLEGKLNIKFKAWVLLTNNSSFPPPPKRNKAAIFIFSPFIQNTQNPSTISLQQEIPALIPEIAVVFQRSLLTWVNHLLLKGNKWTHGSLGWPRALSNNEVIIIQVDVDIAKCLSLSQLSQLKVLRLVYMFIGI